MRILCNGLSLYCDWKFMGKYYDDDIIIKKVLDGDINLFGEIINRYQDLVYGYAYSKVSSISDAQDIAQDVFIKAYRKLDQLGNSENLAAWLKAITINESKNQIQRAKAAIPLDDTKLQKSFVSEAKADFREQEFRTDILLSVEALSENHRTVITLYYLSGMSYEDISESLGIPVAAVVGRLHRARKQLRSDLLEDVERAMSSRRLPDTFTEDVIKRLTLYPIEAQRIYAMIYDDEGILVLGIPGGQSHMLLLAMPRDDMEAIMSYKAGSKAVNPKLQTLISMKEAMDAFGVNPKEVVLYLEKRSSCLARMVVMQGKIEKTLDLRVCDALFLAFRTGIPVLAESNLVSRGITGADNGTYKVMNDVQDFRSRLSVVGQRGSLETAAFKAAPLINRGSHSVRCHADLASGCLNLSVLNTDVVIIINLSDHLLGFKYMCNITDVDGSYSWYEDDDGSLFRVTYAINGGEVVIHFNPHSGAPDW